MAHLDNSLYKHFAWAHVNHLLYESISSQILQNVTENSCHEGSRFQLFY